MSTLPQRALGSTGLTVSALALGTVKLGRNADVKYPAPFDLPDDRAVRELLAAARDLGVTLLDTAPAYGTAEERLGELLPGQPGFLVGTKVGEHWGPGGSSYDFSQDATRNSIERSLRRLRREVLDIVLVHSDGSDRAIVEEHGTLDVLADLKRQGLVRAIGISSKTVEGGLLALPHCDVLMVEWSIAEQRQRPVLEAAAAAGKGALVKKGLGSGHLNDPRAALQFAADGPAVAAVVVGTLSPEHLGANCTALAAQ